MTVTIDGPAGVGKTTLARALAERRGFFLLPSGTVYRAVTYAALQQGVVSPDGRVRGSDFLWMDAIELNIEDGRASLNGRALTSELHTPEVGRAVAPLSSFTQVRDWVNERLRGLARQHQLVVAEGRDMGSEVFPSAELKIFLQASLEVRTSRCRDRGQGVDVLADLRARDQLDYQKERGKLRVANGAHVFHVSSLTFQQVYDRLVDLLESATVTHPQSRRQRLGVLNCGKAT